MKPISFSWTGWFISSRALPPAARAALAKIAVLKGDYEGASKYYRDATLLSPDDTNLRQNYAESLFFTPLCGCDPDSGRSPEE